jgi:hypothetical protein
MRIAAAVAGSDSTVELGRLAPIRLKRREASQAATEVIQGGQ